MSYSLGIDLGTTYTATAIARGRAEVVTLGYRATSVPTVAVLTEEGTFLVGDPAERRGASQPERLAREFKRRVGDPTPVMIGGTPVSVDRLLAEVVRFVLATVAQTEGGPPDATVVTHPANWGPFKRDVLEQALKLAGLDDAVLLPEPAAAVAWYTAAERVAPGATVAVYDLGGGTFDAAVLRWAPTAPSPCGAGPRASSGWAGSMSTPPSSPTSPAPWGRRRRSTPTTRGPCSPSPACGRTAWRPRKPCRSRPRSRSRWRCPAPGPTCCCGATSWRS